MTIHASDGRTDGRTDRQTDGRTEFSSQDRVCIPCSAVKMIILFLQSATCPSAPFVLYAGVQLWYVISWHTHRIDFNKLLFSETTRTVYRQTLNRFRTDRRPASSSNGIRNVSKQTALHNVWIHVQFAVQTAVTFSMRRASRLKNGVLSNIVLLEDYTTNCDVSSAMTIS